MELLPIEKSQSNGVHTPEPVKDIRFIESNTNPVSLDEIRNKHIIPVFVKDNTPTLSQADFIQTTIDTIEENSGKDVANLAIRVSHPIKGRTFEARNKNAAELLEHEKTIYYERMAFAFEVPAYKEQIHGQELTMTVVGVKAYNQDNLYSYGNALQHFKIGVGYKVRVCTNLCLFSDGTALDLKVRSINELSDSIYQLIGQYDSIRHLEALNHFGNFELTEKQFATVIGKARLYNHLPKDLKKQIPQLIVSDSQISSMTREYYKDESFRRNADGSINLWNIYNLLTGSVKSSYIDSFMDRNLNAFDFTNGIAKALDGNGNYQWFLN
jgi:hypothetical protein